MKKNLTKIYVGVDISKEWLDIHCNPINKTMHIRSESLEKGPLTNPE